MAASLWWDDGEAPNKSDQQNKQEELLVFGYACKLFRDDKKAKAIDQGKLLIPWMGDERLMIDRYDGRGHLYDLALHDADNVADKDPVLSEEDAAVEKACEEERYLELHTDLREAQLYEEEEWKRYYLSLQEGYQAVGFSYDQSSGLNDGTSSDFKDVVKTEEEKPFVAPPELNVPPGMLVPTCKKENARIEKTASFIAKQGIQMEIMLKTKQAGNSQFDFLHFDNELNPYYKHVVGMIKSGKYKAVEEEDTTSQDAEHGHSYLHPSLSSTGSQLPPMPLPALKPIELPKVSIHDTPYGALIQSIRRNAEALKPVPKPEPVKPEMPSPDHDWKSDSYSDNPPPPGTQPVTLPTVNGQTNGQVSRQPPPPGTEEDDRVRHPSYGPKRRDRSSSSDSSSSYYSSSSSHSSHSLEKKSNMDDTKAASTPKPPSPEPTILSPPPEVRPIIDRMAMYVAKNGPEFEIVVMNRNDPRFQFLTEYHVYYPYYKLQKDIHCEAMGKVIREPDKDVQDDKLDSNSQRSVSFSIRSRPRDQEGGQPSGKAALFNYDSEGDEKKEAEGEVSSGTAASPIRTNTQSEEDPQKEMEEKLKDKLASAVKERISQSHKEKLIQLERKKKAAAFLNLIKTSSSSQPPSRPFSPTEDVNPAFFGDSGNSSVTSNPIVFEYNNQSQPVLISNRLTDDSPTEKRRRHRSPTPPTSYHADRRSPGRPSPSGWNSRSVPWPVSRERTPTWQHRSRERVGVSKKSRSRSPRRKDEKKKKRKRSKSRSPSKKDKHRDKQRATQEKSKHKSKDKKKKDKSRRRSKERSSRHSTRKSSGHDIFSDVEIIDTPSLSKELREDKVGAYLKTCPSGSMESVTRSLPSVNSSDHLDDTHLVISHHSSTCNSPATHTSSVSRGSTPSRSSLDLAASSDLMSKVRAMLKKSREIMIQEEGFLDDT